MLLSQDWRDLQQLAECSHANSETAHHMNLLPSLSQLDCGAHSRMQFDSTPALQGPRPLRTSPLLLCDQKYLFSQMPSRSSKRQSWDVVKWQIQTYRNINRRTKLRFFDAPLPVKGVRACDGSAGLRGRGSASSHASPANTARFLTSWLI